MKLLKIILCTALFLFINKTTQPLNNKNLTSKKAIKFANTQTDYTPIFNPDSNGNVTITNDDNEEMTFNVKDELKKESDYYASLCETNATKYTELTTMKNALSNLSTTYDEYVISLYKPIDSSKPQPVSETDYLNSYSNDVIAAIAFFAVSGYKLSCELLTKAYWTIDNITETYTPLNYDRIYSSKLLWDCLDDANKTHGSIDLNLGTNAYKDLNAYEKDLAFSIGKVEYTKNSNTQFHLTDTYDFAYQSNGLNQTNTLFNSCVNLIFRAQELGIIKTYDIAFDVDLSKCLQTSITEKSNSYLVTVKNISEEPIQLIYNSKMCFKDDAKEWDNLTNIEYSQALVSSKNSVTIDISKNGFATTLALCYVTKDKRYITYINELNKGVHKKIMFEESDYHVYSKNNIEFSAIGINGSNYILKIKNNSSDNKSITYSSKTADSEDDVDSLSTNSISLSSNKYTFIKIEKNGSKKYIQLKISDLSTELHYKIFISNMNGETKLLVTYVKDTPVYTYLSLRNSNKESGKWKIGIYNPYNYSISVDYNTKMCFEDDAKNWNLKDVKQIECSSKTWTYVLISTNFFATSVAISYTSNNKRIISYANELNTSNGIKVMYNVI